jgi:hypothetical protein
MLVAVIIFATTALVGVGVGRSLRSEPEPARSTPANPLLFDVAGQRVALPESDRDAPVALDTIDVPVRLAPVIAPVAVGLDDEIGQQLLDVAPPTAGDLSLGADLGYQPPLIIGATPISRSAPHGSGSIDPQPASTAADLEPAGASPTGTELIGPLPGEPDAVPTDDEGAIPGAPSSWAVDLSTGFADLIEVIRFDPCAGIEPGTPTPDDCPEGYPATMDFAIRTPPTPQMFFARGHYLTRTEETGLACPADTTPAGPGEAAMTLFSRTPLASAELRYRPYGSSDAWTTMPVPAPPPDQLPWWMERFETLDYEIGWGIVPICLNIPRDPTFAYELEADGVDVFDQPVAAYPTLIPLENPDRRPPTTGQVTGLSSMATVTARTIVGGTVNISSRAVTGPDDDLSCDRSSSVDVARGAPSTVIPVGIYDPAYRQPWVARLPIPPGGQLVVCAQIFSTSNQLRPLATDRLLFSAPTQERPRIVLQGIRRLGDRTIPPGLTVRTGFDDDRCASWYRSAEPLEPGRAHSVEQTLWECTTAPLPVDAGGAVDVPVRVTRTFGSGSTAEVREEEVAIPIRLQPCADPRGCDRPREWYEVPIPNADSRLCGSGFGSEGCGEPLPPDGIAVIRVEYPVVAGPPDPPPAGRGTVTLLDQVDAAAPSGTPRFVVEAVDFRPSAEGDGIDHDGRVRMIADRPLRIDMTPQGWMPPGEEVPEGCADAVTPVSTTEFSDTFELEMSGFCAGVGYAFPFRATDEVGTVFDIDLMRSYFVPSLGAPMTVRVDFLGGPDVPNYGFMYRFGVLLDGQNPTAYWWDWTGSRGTLDGCIGLGAGTSARSRGGAPQHIYLQPNDLSVEVRMNITTTGESDCSGRSASGLGEITINGSFSREQLMSDAPLVLESGPDVAVPIRVTVERVGPWRPSR